MSSKKSWHSHLDHDSTNRFVPESVNQTGYVTQLFVFIKRETRGNSGINTQTRQTTLYLCLLGDWSQRVSCWLTIDPYLTLEFFSFVKRLWTQKMILMSQDKEIFCSFQDIWKFLGTFWIALFVLYWIKCQWTMWTYLFENNMLNSSLVINRLRSI